MTLRYLKLATAAAVIAALVPATAIAANHDTPGTPGDPNCFGQTMAYINEIEDELAGVNGVGNWADAIGLSVKEVKELVRTFCNP
jgi:hypothetical protein